MSQTTRRKFIAAAAALGAAASWARAAPVASRSPWMERRALFPEGVASGDPDHHSVILWTRRPFQDGRSAASLHLEVAEDICFTRVVASVQAPVSRASDWTCRVLVGGLRSRRVYWYRFMDETGAGSRIGRTITAPAADDPYPVRFAFVSCQSVNEGAQNAFRKMIWEDRRAPLEQQLGFVLHLGDFIYEVVQYPDDVAHRYDRTVYDIGRIPDGRKVGSFHVPTTLDGYRMVYRAHIADPDIQDARAWFPFVCIGDNHEFSWQGWQSFVKYPGGKTEPAQRLRVAANQAWWEYIPSRVRKASGANLGAFNAPSVDDAPIARLDQDGLGDEPNNRTALASMTAYRAMRFGPHVELVLTDLHSYAMEDPTSRNEADALTKAFPDLLPEEALDILDAGRTYAGGNPPRVISIGDLHIENFARSDPPVTVLGREQKAWLKQTLKASQATWKIWGATNGTMDMRADPQNLPAAFAQTWPGQGFACFGGGDFSGALSERAELYDFVRDERVSGFAVVSGDRHSFWAGYAAKALPPAPFEPVGVAFICGSLSAPGMAEALEHTMKNHPLRPLFISEREPGKYQSTINLTLKHGVRSALEFDRTGDLEAAHAASNPDNSPHLEFVDMGGHGYAVVTAGAKTIETEFVCIPRPIARSPLPDGGGLRYRVRHTAEIWKPGEKPKLQQTIVEGDVGLSV